MFTPLSVRMFLCLAVKMALARAMLLMRLLLVYHTSQSGLLEEKVPGRLRERTKGWKREIYKLARGGESTGPDTVLDEIFAGEDWEVRHFP